MCPKELTPNPRPSQETVEDRAMFDDTPVDDDFAYHNPALRQCAAWVDCRKSFGVVQCPNLAAYSSDFCYDCGKEFDAEERAQRLDEMPNTDEEDLY